MAINEKIKYCLDSSAFIDSWRRYYPPKVFPTLWEGLSELIVSGRIIVCKEAEKEIMNGNDELKTWFKLNKKCVVPYDNNQLVIVSEIVNKYPKVSQYNKPRPAHADPFVVALAKARNATVVTWEGLNGSSDNPAIPNLCREYQVSWCNMVDLCEREGWSFNHR
ncbi:MAG: DUF4411 family protein [bacterium]|nr:DUF4411 family protein [bacterium]